MGPNPAWFTQEVPGQPGTHSKKERGNKVEAGLVMAPEMDSVHEAQPSHTCFVGFESVFRG